MKKLYQLLEVQPGVTAIIGGGGKTSLMYHLAAELKKKGTVLICTTTHIAKPEHLPFAQTREDLAQLLAENGVACAGSFNEEGKLSAPDFDGWQTMADYVIVEADGSKRLPLKAHLPHEPVIPTESNNVIYVVGLSGLGQPIGQAAHRAERYAELANESVYTKVTAEMAAQVIRTEGLHKRVFLNQTDALNGFTRMLQCRTFAKSVGCPVVAGSLREGSWSKL